MINLCTKSEVSYVHQLHTVLLHDTALTHHREVKTQIMMLMYSVSFTDVHFKSKSIDLNNIVYTRSASNHTTSIFYSSLKSLVLFSVASFLCCICDL